MKLNFNKRLKDYIIDVVIQEGDEEAWAMLKTLNPTCRDLDLVITYSKFKDEAWELFTKQAPTIDELISVMYSNKEEEAIALLLQEFSLPNKTLKKIISEKGNDAAAKVLLNQNPTKNELSYIMRYTNLNDEAAARLLLCQPLDNDELLDIMTLSSLQKEAWEILVRQNPENDELIRIVLYSDLEESAWEQLLKQKPTNEQLLDIVHDYSNTGRKRSEAAAVILKQNPKIGELVDLICNNQMADEAWEMLQKRSPGYKDLESIVRLRAFKVNEVADYMMQKNLTKNQLLQIFENSDRKEVAAELLCKKRLEIKELAAIILDSANEKAVELLSKKVKFNRATLDEQQFMQEIAEKIIGNPELLDVNSWHNGEKHSVGGWAITLSEAGKEVEKNYSSEIAACLLIPGYRHLIFADRERVLDELKKICEMKNRD